MPDILAYKVVARDGNEMPAPHIAQPVQDAGHPERHRGLAGAGVAGEAHVQGRGFVGEAQLLAGALDHKQRRDFADARLDRRKADQLAVQLVQHLGDAGFLVVPAQIHPRFGLGYLLLLVQPWSSCVVHSSPLTLSLSREGRGDPFSAGTSDFLSPLVGER